MEKDTEQLRRQIDRPLNVSWGRDDPLIKGHTPLPLPPQPNRPTSWPVIHPPLHVQNQLSSIDISWAVLTSAEQYWHQLASTEHSLNSWGNLSAKECFNYTHSIISRPIQRWSINLRPPPNISTCTVHGSPSRVAQLTYPKRMPMPYIYTVLHLHMDMDFKK